MDVGINADGRLAVIASGARRNLQTIFQTAPNNGWSGWQVFPFLRSGDPAVGRNADGRLEVFVRGEDSALWHFWQLAPGSNDWSAGESLGATVQRGPVVASNADGTLEVFAVVEDSALWHIRQTAPNDGWSGWHSLGGRDRRFLEPRPHVLISDPAVGQNADGRLEVFAVGTDSTLWHVWQTRPGGGWSEWAQWPFGRNTPVIGRPAVGRDGRGRLVVVARGSDGTLRDSAQGSNAVDMGVAGQRGISSSPVIGENADGRLELLARGADSTLLHLWQVDAHSQEGFGGEWSSLGGMLIAAPSVARNADGRLEVFIIGTDSNLWHIWQVAPNGHWSGWASLGSSDHDGRLVYL